MGRQGDGDRGETGGRRHCLLCPCVYRIELKFPLCFHFVEGLCSLREFCKQAGIQSGGGEGERASEGEKMGEGGHEEGGRMSLFRALIMNKTDSRVCVCAYK